MATRTARRKAAQRALQAPLADPGAYHPTHAQPAVWRDPDDLTPGARRTPREITGWRTSCALRRMLGRDNSGITQGHILAADKLREQIDLASYGYSAERPLIFVQHAAGSRYGLGPAEQARMRADRSVRQVVALFTPGQLVVLEAIVLRNQSIRGWVASLPAPPNPRTVKAALLVVLDRLAAHYDHELEDDLARGRRLPL